MRPRSSLVFAWIGELVQQEIGVHVEVLIRIHVQFESQGRVGVAPDEHVMEEHGRIEIPEIQGGALIHHRLGEGQRDPVGEHAEFKAVGDVHLDVVVIGSGGIVVIDRGILVRADP
ncbi:hypothetical protein SDC9_210076 [bioreactor metagenome]|uniref:Uncharacterized protein n=1 Tax=bioreactor metagenome TaxID=1076179 RepID=A0A645JI03_9ZZZZ